MTHSMQVHPSTFPLAPLAASALALTLALASPATSAADEARFEGAVGLIVRNGPAFPGASDRNTKFTPAGFLRWGRLTVTGAGGFTTRKDDDVERGLALELARRGALRLGLALRYDGGRSASDSPELAGLGDIRNTLRARLSARWDPDPAWRVTGGVSVDTLHRGGGYFADLAVSRRWDLGGGDSIAATAALTGAGDRYLQAWHGVTPQQSVASGLPVFQATEGLRDASASVQWRSEWRAFDQPFAAYVSAGHACLLGSAADSPLTRQRCGSSLSGALAWRF